MSRFYYYNLIYVMGVIQQLYDNMVLSVLWFYKTMILNNKSVMIPFGYNSQVCNRYDVMSYVTQW